jgi:hypothetical protein
LKAVKRAACEIPHSRDLLYCLRRRSGSYCASEPIAWAASDPKGRQLDLGSKTPPRQSFLPARGDHEALAIIDQSPDGMDEP